MVIINYNKSTLQR